MWVILRNGVWWLRVLFQFIVLKFIGGFGMVFSLLSHQILVDHGFAGSLSIGFSVSPFW
jgi:hypothetical protein